MRALIRKPSIVLAAFLVLAIGLVVLFANRVSIGDVFSNYRFIDRVEAPGDITLDVAMTFVSLAEDNSIYCRGRQGQQVLFDMRIIGFRVYGYDDLEFFTRSSKDASVIALFERTAPTAAILVFDRRTGKAWPGAAGTTGQAGRAEARRLLSAIQSNRAIVPAFDYSGEQAVDTRIHW